MRRRARIRWHLFSCWLWHGFHLVGFTEVGGKHRRAIWFAGTFRFFPPLDTRFARYRRRRRFARISGKS